MIMVMQDAPRTLQHWDSALEESGYSPRISTRVTPPASSGDSPAKGRTDPLKTLPLPSDAAASDAHMLGETPSDSPTSGRQILKVPIIPDFDAKDGPNPSGIPPSDGLASDAFTPGQKVITLPPIPESDEEGQVAEPPGSVHLLGDEAVSTSPSKDTCDGERDPVTHVPKLAAALGNAAMPGIQSVQPAAQQPADSASSSDSHSERRADSAPHSDSHSEQPAESASGISAAAVHPAGDSAQSHSSSSLLELVSETAKVKIPDVPLLPRRPTLDGSTVMAVSSAQDPPSTPSLTPSMTPSESDMMPMDGAAAGTVSDSPISQTDKGISLAGYLVSVGGDSAESRSANAASEAAAGASNMQSAAAEGTVENNGAGPADGSPTQAALIEEVPTRAARQGTPSARASATAPAESFTLNGAAGSPSAQGIPTPPVAESLPAEGVPSADAASSPAAQGIPDSEAAGALPGTDMPSPNANSPPAQVILVPEASGDVPAEGIPNRIAARDQVVYPVFGVAREQNRSAYMEDRADVLQLQLPCGEEAHMLAVRPSHTSLHHYLCVQHYLCDTRPLL